MSTSNNPSLAQHDELRRIMTRFAALMNAAPEVDHAMLVRERMVFSRTFLAHLAHEQEEIAQLVRSVPEMIQRIKERRTMIADLRADYSEHVRRWTPMQIKAGWPAYRKEVLALQARLRKFMLWEEENLPLYA